MAEELACLPSVLAISGYDYLEELECFQNGWIQVQDAASAFVGECV